MQAEKKAEQNNNNNEPTRAFETVMRKYDSGLGASSPKKQQRERKKELHRVFGIGSVGSGSVEYGEKTEVYIFDVHMH